MRRHIIFLLVLFPIIGMGQSNTQRSKTIDSLKSIAESQTHDTTRISAYLIWDEYIYIENPALDVEINETVLEIADKNLSKSNLSIEELKFFYTSKATSLNIIGLNQLDYGDFFNAQDNFHKSLEIAEAMGDTVKMAGPLNNLGMIYKAQNFPEKSLEYFERAMDLDGAEDPWSKSIYLNNIGLCYSDMLKHRLALTFFYESIEMSELSGNKSNQANATLNIGEIYYKKQKFDSAAFFYEKALLINQELENKSSQIFCKVRIGLTELKMGRPQNGVAFCAEALDLLKNDYSLTQEYDCHDCLYLSYKQLGDTKNGLYHYEKATKLFDSLYGKKETDKLLNAKFEYQYEKQRLSDSLANDNLNKIQEVEHQADLDSKNLIQTFLFIGLGLVLIIAGFVYRNYKIKKKDNELIAAQKDEVEKQKVLVEERNQEITDSITYAKRLQEAILPSKEKIKTLLPESFVLYLPKDIVAGDFYWIEEAGDKVLFAIADCTGHGVPGALVSVVCNNSLNRAVREFKLTQPGLILDKTRALVIETFKSSNSTVKDGMDITLCCFDKSTRKLEFAGANNSLYLLRNGELNEFKADKQPIGEYMKPYPFTNHQIATQEDDQIFLFTDGFADQFGGEKGKKYKYKPFKEFLVKTAHFSPVKQRTALENEFSFWLGDYEQIDDVCVMGVKFKKP